MDCIFCQIVRRELESSVVHEDQDCIAFLDIQPVNSGHTLVIPKAHYVTLEDCPDEIARHLISITKKLNLSVSQSVRAEGIFNAIMNGEAANQEIFHLHLHIIPRFRDDGFGFVFADTYGKVFPDRSELDSIAERIRQNAIPSPIVTKGHAN